MNASFVVPIILIIVGTLGTLVTVIVIYFSSRKSRKRGTTVQITAHRGGSRIRLQVSGEIDAEEVARFLEAALGAKDSSRDAGKDPDSEIPGQPDN
jgi:hypothetical protein